MPDPGWEALKAQFWPGVQDAGHDAATLLSGVANGIVDTPQLLGHALKQLLASGLQGVSAEGSEGLPPAQLPAQLQPGEFSPVLSPLLPQSEVRNGYDAELKEYGNALGQLAGPAAYGKGIEGLTALEGSGDAAGAFGNQLGAIRIKGDLLSPAVAQSRADWLMRNAFGPSPEDAYPELAAALKKHIQKYGGTAQDPLHDVPMQGEDMQHYSDFSGVSAEDPGNYFNSRARSERGGLKNSEDGTWGAFFDKNLSSGMLPHKAIFASGDGDPSVLSSPFVRRNVDHVMQNSGTDPRFWAKQYINQPEDALTFNLADPKYVPPYGSSEALYDLARNLDGTDLTGKTFADMVNAGNKNYAAVLRDQLKKQKGEPVLDTGDGYNWQKLAPSQLEWEGSPKNMAHCIGGYCDDVESGGTNVYSLRNNETNEPKITLSTGNDRYRNLGRPNWLPYSSTQQPLHMVGQIKGKANAIRPEFADNVQKLADHLGLDLSDSGDWYLMNPELAAQKKLELQGEPIERAEPYGQAPVHPAAGGTLPEQHAAGLIGQHEIDEGGLPITVEGLHSPPGQRWYERAEEDIGDHWGLDPNDPNDVVSFLHNRLQAEFPGHPGRFHAEPFVNGTSRLMFRPTQDSWPRHIWDIPEMEE